MSEPQAPVEKPYVPAQTDLPELTARALILGLLMAVVLGAANAYLGLRAGLTVSATFPAAVLAIAAFRLPFMRGGVLEQNIARTTASVGEALVAGAIFTIPAFVMVEVGGERLWTSFNYWETSLLLLIGGTLGILFVILLRRTLVVDAQLPFPESYACFEIVKAGQKGETGAGYVFGALGLGMLHRLVQRRKADRGERHAGGGALHPLGSARLVEAGLPGGALPARTHADRGRRRGGRRRQPSRARHQPAVDPDRDGAADRADDADLLLLHPQRPRGGGHGGDHDRHGLPLLGRGRLAGGPGGRLQPADLGAHAVDADRRGGHHGGDRRHRPGRRRRGAGGVGGGVLRLVDGRLRRAAEELADLQVCT